MFTVALSKATLSLTAKNNPNILQLWNAETNSITMEYHSATEKNNLLIYRTWMTPKYTMLS